MYAYDRRTHHTSELTHAPDKSDGSPPPFVPGYTTVSGYGHRIAWAQATGTVTHSRVDIFTCSLPHCVPRLAVARAGFPQVTSHGIYAIRFNQDVFGIRRHKNLDQAHFRIVFEHSSQSAVRLVQRLPAGGQTSSVTGFAASDDVQIVTELFRPKGTRALIRYHAKLLKVRGRVGQFSQLFSYPVVGKGFVAWAESSGSATQLGGYLLDLANRRVYSLGNQGGLYGIWAAGPYVAWQQQIGPGSGPPSVVDLVAKVN